jgi:histidinol dehydrogenase
MQIYLNPPPADWADILKRPAMDLQQLEAPVAAIMQEVSTRGDAALLDLTAKYDGVRLADLGVSQEEIALSSTLVEDKLQAAIRTAAKNIERFHAAQKDQTPIVETMPGVRCWRKSVGIERVGLYVPGGTAPLFSTVLMLAIPARLAGCKEIVLCTPPQKDGSVHPAILFAAKLAGVKQIFRVGGAQAIAAMAYGTEQIPATSKIFGPGNAYVTVAKQLAGRAGVAIDMPAGPSEVMVVADDTAIPAFVAADLLSQAEHGADSQVVLISYSEAQARSIMQAMEQQLASLPRKDFAAASLSNSSAIVIKTDQEAVALINAYAPEHLILALDEPERLTDGIINAGSVFMGHYTPESVGDYASGTNHTLPTNGYARAYSGVSLDSFVRKITFQQLNEQGIRNLGPTVMTMAEAELLDAHKLAVSVRLASLKDKEAADQMDTADITGLVRDNIAVLRPYSSARHEFTGTAEVFLDANENPYENGTNRYPDPLAVAVKKELSTQKGLPTDQIMLANGSDEIIDLLFRIFCEPGRDEVITLPPTYGMYQVSADINHVKVKEVPLLPGFAPDVDRVLNEVGPYTKLLWLCTPNNPSGNDFPQADIIRLLEAFPGIVIIDEAYVDFADRASYTSLLARFPRLVIMQTFSKAWGMAGIRMGIAFASQNIIQLLNAVKPPYNVNVLSQQAALKALQNKATKERQVQTILAEREQLSRNLVQFPFVEKVHPSDTNFLLVKVADPQGLYHYLNEAGIVVRDRSKQISCEGCLRFTVGTPTENAQLMEALVAYRN